jgi:hypothetical protein
MPFEVEGEPLASFVAPLARLRNGGRTHRAAPPGRGAVQRPPALVIAYCVGFALALGACTSDSSKSGNGGNNLSNTTPGGQQGGSGGASGRGGDGGEGVATRGGASGNAGTSTGAGSGGAPCPPTGAVAQPPSGAGADGGETSFAGAGGDGSFAGAGMGGSAAAGNGGAAGNGWGVCVEGFAEYGSNGYPICAEAYTGPDFHDPACCIIPGNNACTTQCGKAGGIIVCSKDAGGVGLPATAATDCSPGQADHAWGAERWCCAGKGPCP